YRVYGPAVDEPLVEVNLANGAKPTAYLHHDALGSITCATDPNGNVVYRNSYRAFGQRTSTTPPNTDTLANAFTRLSYTSRETSVGSLYQYRSRYYDAGYGRFVQQDNYDGCPTTPISENRFVYVWNNPATFNDAYGFFPGSAAQCPGGNWVLTGISVGAFIFGIGYEISWTSYKCTSGMRPRCNGWTLAAPLFGAGTDVSASTNAGAV